MTIKQRLQLHFYLRWVNLDPASQHFIRKLSSVAGFNLNKHLNKGRYYAKHHHSNSSTR